MMLVEPDGNVASWGICARLHCQAGAVKRRHEGGGRAAGSTKATLESQLVTHKLPTRELKLRAHRIPLLSLEAEAGRIEQKQDPSPRSESLTSICLAGKGKRFLARKTLSIFFPPDRLRVTNLSEPKVSRRSTERSDK